MSGQERGVVDADTDAIERAGYLAADLKAQPTWLPATCVLQTTCATLLHVKCVRGFCEASDESYGDNVYKVSSTVPGTKVHVKS